MQIKERISDALYIIFAILAIPLAISSITRIGITGWKWLYAFHILAACIPPLIILFRKKIPYEIKIYLALTLLFSIVFTGMLSFGYLGNSKFFLILVVALAGLFLGRKQGYFALLVSCFLLIFFTVIFHIRLVKYDFDVGEYVIRPSTWISMSITIIAISLGLLEIITRLFKAQAEISQKVEESERLFQTLIRQAADAVYLSDMEGKIIDVNQQACQQTGYSRQELLNMTVMDLDRSYPTLKSLQEMWKDILPDQSIKIEGKHIKKDGSEFPAEISISVIALNTGKHILGLTRDISDRKKAEEEIRESEEKYRLLFEKANDSIFLMDGARFIDCNPETLLMYGCEYNEIVGKTPYDFSPEFQPDGLRSERKALKLIRASLKGEIKTFEWVHTRKNGENFFAEVNLNRITLNNKNYIQAIVRDITARKLSEAALQESNAKYKRLANATFEGIGYSYKGQIIETNSRIIQMYGYTEDEFKKLELKDLVYPEDLPVVMKHIASNDESPYEHRAIRKDGSIFYIEARGKTVEIDNKIMRLTILRDITERKNYELNLAASEQKFRNIFNTSSDGIIVSDFELNILAANQIICEFEKLDETQIRTKKINDFMAKHSIPDMQKLIQMHKRELQVPVLDMEIVKYNGDVFPVEISSKVIDYENKKAILLLLHDISERKQVQQRIIQAIIQTEEKERSHFAKELHDGLGPLLSTMNIYAGTLRDSKDESRRKIAIDRIKSSIEEGILSIRQISNSLSPHVLQNFGLTEAIKNFYTKLIDIKKIEFKFKSNLTDRLNQNVELTVYRVIVELINNSLKYSGAGIITIAIFLEKKLLKVSYSDNGKGFDIEKTLEGTMSMGLHNIYNRIHSLNGKVELTSREGKGMKAVIQLKIK